MMLRLITLAVCLTLLSSAGFTQAKEPLVLGREWSAYKEKFLEPNGRIVDNGNGAVSHSEGQGYGLLLAYLADSPSDFEQIWSFTRTELLLRDDGLSAWKWEPDASPHVQDINNATDGDLLIAYALGLAGSRWKRMDFIQAAARMAQSILSKTVISAGGRTILLPGAIGFRAEDRQDGPVVNPSYWIFEALPVMGILAPSDRWQALSDDGLELIRTLQIDRARLPPEWVSLKQHPVPAKGFEAQFSYNAIRIPLYLARSNINDPGLMRGLMDAMVDEHGIPAVIDLLTGRPVETLRDPGYRAIRDFLACRVDGTPLPPSSIQFQPDLYYPATLQLLVLAGIREKYPSCL
ncbi:Endoglucanase Y (plasmid) [Neorhizobium galegae bv. officinalis bv. officinalis str. HAMBI 1141]|uniref:Glucanase n=2 Tax=Neorhizobium galegae TaxID=399 RepID=A0A068TIK5_NEOGA|nr:Endoglucanase Y [Neorhizobium galegae bv. officinalis bv. officinalis str. HAMBI 1141]